MESSDFWKQIESDEVFSKFTREEFDAKSHATQAIESSTVTRQLSKLVEGIDLLDKEIHSQVVAHHEDLLSQATGVETLEGVLGMMQARIHSLLDAVERIKAKVTEPYLKIVSRTNQLRRLQEACDLLRRVIRIQYLTKKLRTQIENGAREITKAAQSINELDYLSEGVNLDRIQVIEPDRRFIKQARKEVESQAQKMMQLGLETLNQSQVATSLQVFHNLGSLNSVVNNVVKRCNDSLKESILTSLDAKALSQATQISKGAPGRSTMPAPGNTAQFRASLWTNMDKLMDNIFSISSQVYHLQRVLMRKRDPVTHVCFMDELIKVQGSEINILRSFWEKFTSDLSTGLSNAVEDSSFVCQAFEGEYPKLLRMFNDLWKRLCQLASSNKLQVTSVELAVDTSPVTEIFEDKTTLKNSDDISYSAESALRAALSPYENAYLSKSLSRLFDPINLIFSGGDPPSSSEVEGIVKSISSELGVASVDQALSITIAKNIAKTIQLFSVKCEQLLCTDGEASQVINAPMAGQTLNASIVNSLDQLHESVTKVVGNITGFTKSSLEPIYLALEGVLTLMGSAINPLLTSIYEAIEAIILTMHSEDFSGSEVKSDTQQCSLYMRELQQFVSRVKSSYLAQYTCNVFLYDRLHPLACKSIEMFIRHSSLIRPLGEGGKIRLSVDFAQMELSVVPLCRRTSDLGQPYRQLRAFRPLLFQSNELISESTAVGEVIPYSTVLMFLFSRAPVEMKSAHQAVGWSITRYSQWLESHPNEYDRLMLIKGALESYEQMMKSREAKEFAEIYPIMLKLLQKGLTFVAP